MGAKGTRMLGILQIYIYYGSTMGILITIGAIGILGTVGTTDNMGTLGFTGRCEKSHANYYWTVLYG